MHELSIAISIVDIAIRQANASLATSVSCVELDIGTISGIEYESLQFALSVAVNETILEDTEFKINKIEALMECNSCDNLFTPNGLNGKCPDCTGTDTTLIKGKELQIRSLLVE